MGIRWCGISAMPLALCILLGAPATGQQKQPKPQNSIESLFEGLPAGLRKNVKSNQVRIDRANDWLKEHVNGKGKTIEVRAPVYITPSRAEDGTYKVQIKLPVGPEAPTVTALGDSWPLILRGTAVRVKGKGVGGKGGFRGIGPFPSGFLFVGVRAADAEKLADMKAVTIRGKVDSATVGSAAVILILDDVSVDGKKLTPYKPAAEK